MKKILISTSILSANFAYIGEEVKNVIKAGSDIIHFDVMDNFYVKNLTFGPVIYEAIRNYGINAPIEIHLMTRLSKRLILEFIEKGADCIIFHPEICKDTNQILKLIKTNGCKSGIAFNPNVSLSFLESSKKYLDIALIMSVNPGLGGQKFIESSLKKISEARKIIKKTGEKILLSVDGGINSRNVAKIVSSGPDILVIGSAIFNSSNYKTEIKKIRNYFNIKY
ncbi:ribulose phosphate epimerase [Candidatus Riesia sp. GBBU]|nr:ribulose phosphate epimerase [Candidatus Riesia sp. GBBU]ARC55077.1 ribulose phosphate epimerase [Candidatus Riesia sp. GBBU]